MAKMTRMQPLFLLFLVVALLVGQQAAVVQAQTANDGTAAGRKLEREKRRAELRKNNPNYKEKTPEQKAEIERKRQERMAEEAARFQAEDL
jgi:hypothetical protein